MQGSVLVLLVLLLFLFLYLLVNVKSKKEKRDLVVIFVILLVGFIPFYLETQAKFQAFEDHYEVEDYKELVVRPLADGFYEIYIDNAKELIYYNPKDKSVQLLSRENLKYSGLIVADQ